MTGGEVWWLEQPPAGPEFQYLYPPYEWHYGHATCLSKIAKYSNRQTGHLWEHRKSTTVPEFMARLPHYEQWFQGHADHWAAKRAGKVQEHPHKVEFEHFRDRIRRVLSRVMQKG